MLVAPMYSRRKIKMNTRWLHTLLKKKKKNGYSKGLSTTHLQDLTRRAERAELLMEKADPPNRDNDVRKGIKTSPPANMFSRLESKSGEAQLIYDTSSGFYYNEIEPVFDAGSALDSSTLQSVSLGGRDDRSADTGTTDKSDFTDTSEIIAQDLREEVTEICGRPCPTLDTSLRNITQTRTYRILSMIGSKVVRETVNALQRIQKLQFSEIAGGIDKSFKYVSAAMDSVCEKCESKARTCTE